MLFSFLFSLFKNLCVCECVLTQWCVFVCVSMCVYFCLCISQCVCGSQDNLSNSSCCPSCLRRCVLFFTIVYARLPGWQSSGVSLVSVSHLLIGMLTLHMCSTIWVYMGSGPPFTHRANSSALCCVFIMTILHLCLVDVEFALGLNYIREWK